jgi:hypothetical protein
MSEDDFISWKPGAASGRTEKPNLGVSSPPEAADVRSDPRSGDSAAIPHHQPSSWPVDESTPATGWQATPETTADSAPRTRPRLAKVAMVAVPVLLVGGVAGAYVWNGSQTRAPQTPVAASVPAATNSATSLPSSTASAPAVAPSLTDTPPAPTTPPPATVKAHAASDASHEQLDALAQADAKYASSKLDGRWVAMLSSKTDGTVDPLQKTTSGGHTWHWKDILAEHERLREDPRFSSSLFLILSTKFGAAVKSANGKPYYVTAVDNGFIDAAEVRSWCAQTFSDLPTAQRLDACAPAQMTPVR